jgi:hypothetical protein
MNHAAHACFSTGPRCRAVISPSGAYMCYEPTLNPVPLGKLSNNSTKQNMFGAACAEYGSVAKYQSTHFLLPTLPELQLHLCSPTCIKAPRCVCMHSIPPTVANVDAGPRFLTFNFFFEVSFI